MSKGPLSCPQNANYAIQNGCNLARARVLRFKHNDVADLERVLERVAAEDLKSKCAGLQLGICSNEVHSNSQSSMRDLIIQI